MSSQSGNMASLFAEESSLYCSAEWHLARLKSQCAGIIYSHALRLSVQSENYYCSIPTMAAYFHKDPKTIRQAFQQLAELGFFDILRQERGRAVNYRPVRHSEWAACHPGQCVEKLEMPWDSEGDPLGRALYSASGARVSFFPNVLKALRRHGLSDDEIISEWKQFLPDHPMAWRGVVKRFTEYLSAKKGRYQGPPATDVRYPLHPSSK